MSSRENAKSSEMYAVIFTSVRTEGDHGYAQMAEHMFQLASQQPGFIDVESACDDALGITVSYWDSLQAIEKWKAHSEHLMAKKLGKEKWYESFKLRICKVQKELTFDKNS